jgi:hypothetical protein
MPDGNNTVRAEPGSRWDRIWLRHGRMPPCRSKAADQPKSATNTSH